jgi:hypothetical protein
VGLSHRLVERSNDPSIIKPVIRILRKTAFSHEACKIMIEKETG